MIRTVLDPVCQMEIRPHEAVAVARFEGQRFYFCTASCCEEFLDLPHRFVTWDDRTAARPEPHWPQLDRRRLPTGGRGGR